MRPALESVRQLKPQRSLADVMKELAELKVMIENLTLTLRKNLPSS